MEQEKKTYTVTWLNEDGNILKTDKDVPEGVIPSFDGETPAKPEDKDYTYQFSGWNPEPSALTADVSYTAQYTKTEKRSDALEKTRAIGNAVTVSVSAPAGAFPKGTTIEITAAGDADVSAVAANAELVGAAYVSFVKDGEEQTAAKDVVVSVVMTSAQNAGDAYRAFCENNGVVTTRECGQSFGVTGCAAFGVARIPAASYTVTFDPANGKDPSVVTVANGAAIGNSIPPVPVKEGFRFDGWADGGREITADTVVTANMTVAATYTRQYTVSFDPANGADAGTTITVDAGAAIGDGMPADPTKEDCEFIKWVNAADDAVEITANTIVAEDLTAVAVYTVQMPAVTFQRSAGGVSVTVVASKGTFPAGTNMILVPIAASASLGTLSNALDRPVVDARIVDISFWFSGKEVQPEKPVTVTMGVGAFGGEENLSIVHIADNGAVSVVASDVAGPAASFEAEHFSRYGVIVPAQEPEESTDPYQLAGKEYAIVFSAADGSDAGDAMTFTPGNNGLNADGVTVRDDSSVDYTDDHVKITWVFEPAGDGNYYLKTKNNSELYFSYSSGVITLVGPEEKTEKATKITVSAGASGGTTEGKYRFSWEDGNQTVVLEEVVISGNSIYVGTADDQAPQNQWFSLAVRTATVTWKNDDGTVLATDENAEYGTTPSYTGETPTKTKTAQYTYTFDGWDPEVGTVTGDAEYTAKYSSSVNKYTITYKPGDHGTFKTKTEEAEYGAKTPKAPDTTGEAGYLFAGWSPEVADTVTADAAYVAKWKVRTDLTYTVHYYLKGTAKKITDDKVVKNQTFGAKVEEKAVKVKGYKAVKPTGKSITIGASANEIVFYYEPVNDDKVVVTISGAHWTHVYDGKQHCDIGYIAVSNNKEYNKGINDNRGNDPNIKYTGDIVVARTNVGTSYVDLRDVKFENRNPKFTNVKFVILCDCYTTYEITPRTVVMTSVSDEKNYDGSPLTNDKVTVTGDGFVRNEGAKYTFTGSQTEVGSSKNTFNYTLTGGALVGNYRITRNYGTLTVKAAVPGGNGGPIFGMLGGWKATDSPDMSEKTTAAFEKAMKGFVGVKYEPVAWLGQKLVSGSNYAILCRAQVVRPDAQPYYAIVYIYENLEGNAEILKIVSLTRNGEVDENAGAAEQLMGGWTIAEEQKPGLEAFEKAAKNLLGVKYTPVYVLSSQVLSGTNYCVLARAKTVAPGAEAYYTLATVYQDLSGNVEITEFRVLDIGALYEEATE